MPVVGIEDPSEQHFNRCLQQGGAASSVWALTDSMFCLASKALVIWEAIVLTDDSAFSLPQSKGHLTAHTHAGY